MYGMYESKCVQNGGGKKPSPEEYLQAVDKLRTMDDTKISSFLGVNRSSVYRFRMKEENADTIKEAEVILEKYSDKIHLLNIHDRKVFEAIPIISDWINKLESKPVSQGVINRYVRGIHNICVHYNVHPNNLTLEMCVEINQEMKTLYRKGEKQPKGLAYTSIRESIRGFFMLMHKMSAEYLSSEGVTKEATLGQGKYAKQRVPQEVRHKLEATIKPLVQDYNEYLEIIGANQFMYYTATRIGATLDFSFTTNEYDLRKDVWKFEVIDKGEHATGRLKWTKILTDYGLEAMKKYASERFNIPIEELEARLPHEVDKLFTVSYERIVDINKVGLINAGLQYREFPPNHIWRHTFAQDFLDATDRNYELCCELGGWVNSGILKKHYGAMSEEDKIRGLKTSQGIEYEKKKRRLLKW